MYIENSEVKPDNDIERNALKEKEDCIIDGSVLKESKMMLIALALDTVDNEGQESSIEDFYIFIDDKDIMQLVVKEEGSWKTAITVVPSDAAVFYAAYILDNNKELIYNFEQAINIDKAISKKNLYTKFKDLKEFKINKIIDSQVIADIVKIDQDLFMLERMKMYGKNCIFC